MGDDYKMQERSVWKANLLRIRDMLGMNINFLWKRDPVRKSI